MAIRWKETLFNKKTLISFFVAFLMVSSILAIWQGDPSVVSTFNSHNFKIEGDYYTTKVNRERAYFHYLPESTTIKKSEIPYMNELKQASIWTILFNPQDENVAVIDLIRSEIEQQDKTILKKEITYGKLPEISCAVENEGTGTRMIIFRTGEEHGVAREENCIVLEARTANDLLLLKDTVLYYMFEIIEEKDIEV